MDARVALTLRTVGGLSTKEIARAFLSPEPTRGAAARAGEAEDPRCRHPVPGSAARAPRGTARWGARGALPGLQRGVQRDERRSRPRDLCDEAIWLTRVVDRLLPGEPEVAGSARPDAAAAFPSRRPNRRPRRPRAARGPGSLAMGSRHDRRGPRHARPGARAACARSLSAAGGGRSAARSGAAARGHRLATDRRPLRGARGDGAVAGRRAEPRGGGRDGRRSRRRVADARGARRRARAPTTCSTRPGRTCCAVSSAPTRLQRPTGGPSSSRRTRPNGRSSQRRLGGS